jgi:hypothetical protein
MDSQDSQIAAFINSDTLNNDFLAEVIENKLNISRNNFKVGLVYITSAAGKNENYISLVLRCKIKVHFLKTNKSQLTDVIIKVSMDSFKEANELSVFQREQFVYENLITKFEELWLEKAGEKVEFGPKALKFQSSPHEVIVLDDLKALDYIVLERTEGLNVQQSQVFLSKLAKFHAAGAVQFQKVST